MLSDKERQRRSDAMKEIQAKKKAAKLAGLAEVSVHAEEAIKPAVRAESQRNKRPRRNLFDGRQQQLAVYSELPGYKLHIFNNDPGKIEAALASDWEYVVKGEVEVLDSRRTVDTDQGIGSNIEFHVKTTGTSPAGRGILMKKRMEFVEEDEKIYNDRIDQQERQMIKSQGANAGAIGNTYVPGPVQNKPALTITRSLTQPKGDGASQ